jgi:hypothetical protein
MRPSTLAKACPRLALRHRHLDRDLDGKSRPRRFLLEEGRMILTRSAIGVPEGRWPREF